MSVFVTGATGVLGRRLVDRLTDRGHDVVCLVRDDAGADRVASLGGETRIGDVLDPASLERTVDDGVHTVVHAATDLPTKRKPTAADWERNDRVRLAGTRNLLEAVENPEHVVFPSVVWVARQPDGSAFDEDAPRHPDRATRSAAAVEDLLREHAARSETTATVLRLGFLYAPDAAHTRGWGTDLLSRDLPVVGGGLLGRQDASISVLHADDAGRALADAVEAKPAGCYHVVDDEPVTWAALFGEFASLLDAPEPRRIPWWLARPLVGRVTVDLVTTDTPTTADRFRDAVGWEPRYPTYCEGVRQVVETWRRTGALDTLAGDRTE